MKKLEEIIEQKQFRNAIEKIVLNIKYTDNWLDDKFNPIFREYGIYYQHFNILSIVNGQKNKPILPKQIKSKMLENTRDLTRLMDKLEHLGWIVREQDPSNRRQKLVTITKDGVAIWEEIKARIEETYRTFDNLNEEEVEKLSYLLDKLRSA